MRGVPSVPRPVVSRGHRAAVLSAAVLLAAAIVPSAADAGTIPTQTTVRCFGIGNAGPRSCQLGVYADVPPGAPAPDGIVAWTSSGAGAQTVTGEVPLNAYHPDWGPPFPNVVWNEFSFSSPGVIAPRTESIVAAYPGDALYASSIGTTTYYVRDPDGDIPEATGFPERAWRPQPAGGKDRVVESAPVAVLSRATVSGLGAGPTGLTFSSSGPAAAVVRIERRVRRVRAGGRTATSWRTVRRLRRTLSGGSNRIAVHLRPGVHRISIGGATVQRVQRTVTVRR